MLDRLASWDISLYCADGWESYAQLIPDDLLIQSKKETVHIERNNCRNRHWFARFKRKTIAFSRSPEMVDLTMGLFAKYRVNGTIDELLNTSRSLFCGNFKFVPLFE